MQAVNTAAAQLSGEAFKLWVRMAMNQDGYLYQLDPAELDKVIGELEEHGYLHPQCDGRMLFTDDAGTNKSSRPESWPNLFALYSGMAASEQAEYDHVKNKLSAAHLENEIESILLYWQCHFDELTEQRKVGRRVIHNPLRFDFAVVLTWYLWDHFVFEFGDRLPLDALRYHDEATKYKVADANVRRRVNHVVMDGTNLPFWNAAFSQRKIEVPVNIIGEILQKRTMEALS